MTLPSRYNGCMRHVSLPLRMYGHPDRLCTCSEKQVESYMPPHFRAAAWIGLTCTLRYRL